MEPKIEIKVDNKELANYFEAFLDDFKQVAEDMLSAINVDRGATLKIPDAEYNRLKRVAEGLDLLAKKKFVIENAPDFQPVIDSLGRVQRSIEAFKFPKTVTCEMPEMIMERNIATPEIDMKPVSQAIERMEKLFLGGLGVRITNFDEMPLVFDKVTGSTSSGGGGDASEATLQSILTQLTAINANTDTLEVKAENINLNTDTLETLIGTSNTNLGNIATSVGLIDDAIYTDGSGTPSKGIAVIGTDGTNPQIIKTDANGELQVDVLTMPTVAVTGTFWQATQPVSIAAAVAVTDNSGSLTVDAPVGTPVFVRLSDGSSAISTLPVSLASVPSHAVTNAGTFVVQENGSALTALQLIDDIVHSSDAAFSKAAAIAGQFDDVSPGTTTENNIRPIRMSTRRELYVQIRDAAGNERGLNIDASGQLAITVASLPSHAVTNVGTFVVQENGAALTSLQLIDDVVYTDDTSTHATGTSKGVGIMAVATPTDAAVDANDIGMVAMTTSRQLKVDASGVAVPVTDNSGSLSVDWNGTQPVTGSGNATGALRVELANNGTGVIATVSTLTNITNWGNIVDNAGFTDGTTRLMPSGYIFDEVAGTALTENDAAAARIDSKRAQVFVIEDETTRGQRMTVTSRKSILVEGPTAADAAIAAAPVTIGGRASDTVPSAMSAGGDVVNAWMGLRGEMIVALEPKAFGGCSIYRTLDLDETEEDVKTSAGTLYGYFIFNAAATTRYVKIYNATAASVTVGSTTPVLTIPIPAGAAANVEFSNGIAFSTAICIAATTGVADADTGAPAANDVIMNVFYK